MTDTDPRLEVVARAMFEAGCSIEWADAAENERKHYLRKAAHFIAMHDSLRAFDQAQSSPVNLYNYEDKISPEGYPWSEAIAKEIRHNKATAPKRSHFRPAHGDQYCSKCTSAYPEDRARTCPYDQSGELQPQPESEVMSHEQECENHSRGNNATAPVMGADPPWFKDCIAAAHRAWLDTSASNEIINWHAIVRAVLTFASAQPDPTTGSNNAQASPLPGFVSAAAREAGEAGRRADPPWIGVAVETFLACRPTEGSDRERLGRRLRAVLNWYNARPPSEAEIRAATHEIWDRTSEAVNMEVSERLARAALIAAAKARSGA